MKNDSLHVAVIMDGNGRWAVRRRRPRSIGHRAGGRAVRRIVECAVRLEIDVLTLYAFSSDNWARPAGEVRALMQLFARYLASEVPRCLENGVRVNVIGRRDRLAPDLVRAIERAEAATAAGSRLLLRLAVDYSARQAIVTAARRFPREGSDGLADFATVLNRVVHSARPVPPVDLLIRTGGEQRLSDFLLWECAYAELVFTPRLWPDFDENDLTRALGEYRRRERRFGRVPASAPSLET
jgi:undecaprenyl diphosphate synthase